MYGTSETEIAAGQVGAVDARARAALERGLNGEPIDHRQALHLLQLPDVQTPALLAVAGHIRTQRKGRTVTFSPKVFLPITNLCLDRCSYCTFRKDPDEPDAWTMLPEDVRACCDAGRARGCIEALMCLGDKPERAYPAYRQTLAVLGHRSTVEYVAACCASALAAGLLPHTNAGLLTRDEMLHLKPLNVSLGLMLESVSPRLRQRGGAHQHAPDKDPQRRLAMIRGAGVLRIPSTTGILLIGGTLEERVDSHVPSASCRPRSATSGDHRAISAPSRPPGWRAPPNPSLDTARTIAVARLMLPDMNIQAPPT
jgi:FO synthase